MEVDILDVRHLCQDDAVQWTAHVAQRLIKRSISPDEVLEVLMHGVIIEQYPTDYPYPSCLMFAMVHGHRPIHVVCSVGAGKLFIITAYEPDKDRWDTEFMRRKKEGDC